MHNLLIAWTGFTYENREDLNTISGYQVTDNKESYLILNVELYQNSETVNIRPILHLECSKPRPITFE